MASPRSTRIISNCQQRFITKHRRIGTRAPTTVMLGSRMDEQIDRIIGKMNQLGLKANPVLPEDEVRKYESNIGIRLPIEYRKFLTCIGNGGDGPPHYGLTPLGENPDAVGIYAADNSNDFLKVNRPFPFTKHWVWENGESSSEGVMDDLLNGNIYIGHDGCDMKWYLIVTGEDRGVPWQICGEGAQPVCPKRNFLQWYEDWLDGKDSFFGFPEPI